MRKKNILITLPALFLLVFFSGCNLGSSKTVAGSGEYPVFLPPTISPTITPTVKPTDVIPDSPGAVIPSDQLEDFPETEEDCSNGLEFRDDLTIPDGTNVVAGSTLDKQWEVRNSGTCNWTSGYTLTNISGDNMGVTTDQDLVPARRGSTVTIRIIFVAPDEPGSYTSAWQAVDKNGNLFGDPIFIDINVE
jgi:hypothetical protein